MKEEVKKMKCISCGVEFKKKKYPVNKIHAVKCDSCFRREDCTRMTGRFGI